MLIKMANQIRERKLIACRRIPNILWKYFTHKEVEQDPMYLYKGTLISSL